MRRKAVVALALMAGALCGGGIRSASAGHWVEVPNPYGTWWPSSPEEIAENASRLDGTVDWGFDDYYTGTLQHYAGSTAWKDSGEEFAGFTPLTVYREADGGYIYFHDAGQRRSKFHWVRNTDPMTGQPDPNDNPPATLYLKITAGASGNTCSDTSNQLRDITKEHITASVMGEAGTESSWQRYDGAVFKTVGTNVTRLMSVATNGQEVAVILLHSL